MQFSVSPLAPRSPGDHIRSTFQSCNCSVDMYYTICIAVAQHCYIMDLCIYAFRIGWPQYSLACSTRKVCLMMAKSLRCMAPNSTPGYVEKSPHWPSQKLTTVPLMRQTHLLTQIDRNSLVQTSTKELITWG